MLTHYSFQEISEEFRARVAEFERLRHAEEESDVTSDVKRVMADTVVSDSFEYPHVMVVVADLVEGRFLRFNQAMCDILGYSERELLEVSFLDRVHPEDRMRTMLEMERLAAGEPTHSFRNRYLDANGTYRVFEWTAIADESREMCYAMAVEVTE